MPKEIIGFYISKDFCVCSDPTRNPKSNEGMDILQWLSTFSDSINILYSSDWNVACLLRRLNLKKEQLNTLLTTTKLWIEPALITLIPEKFFSVRWGKQYDAPYAMFSAGDQYSQPEFIEGDRDYCYKKATEIQKIGCEVYDALCAFKFIPDSLVSPAQQFSKHLLHRFQFPTVEDMPENVGEIAFESFDAGLFECYKKGTFTTWDYDINCYSEDTEVLTLNGWKLIKKLKLGEQIFTFNPAENKCYFQPVIQLHKSFYDGEMINIENKHVSLLVTPNHTILAKDIIRSKESKQYKLTHKLGKGKWQSWTAKDLPNGNVHLPISYPSLDKLDYPIADEMLQLIAWIVTEGNANGLKSIGIAQSNFRNPSHCNEIRDILNKLQIKYSENRTRGTEDLYFRIYANSSFDIRSLLTKQNIHTIPIWILQKCSNRQLQLFYNTLIKGDGTRRKATHTSKFCSSDTFFTNLKINADRLMYMCHLLGYKSFIYTREYTYGINLPISEQQQRLRYHVNINRSEDSPLRLKGNKHDTTIIFGKKITTYYKGMVYCPTVDNHFIIVRRNGKSWICGNSAYMKSLSTCPDTRLGSFKEVTTLGDTPLGFYRGLVTIYPDANLHPVGYPMGEGDDKVSLTPSGTWPRSVPRSYIDFITKHKKGEFEVKWGVEWQPKELKFIYAPLMKRIYEMKQESQGLKRQVMKTVGLSIWGKQGELKNDKFGDFFNPIPYTFGASNTRITVLEACMQNNTIPIAIQVDGVATEKPLEYLNIGTGLGQWKLSHANKPCISVNADILAIEGKSNNQPFSVEYEAFKKQIEQDPGTNLYSMTANTPVTLGKSLNLNDIDHLGDIRPTTRTIDISHEAKRLFKDMPQTGRELLSGQYDSVPVPIEMLELSKITDEKDLTFD